MYKKKIFYWAPFLVPIATSRAVINSCYSMNKFSKKSHCSIINFFGEFNHLSNEIIDKKIKLLNFYSKYFKNFLPKHGFLGSRFSFIVIFTFSFFPLKNLLKKEKPDYLIIHLLTSLPLILLILFNFKTRFILRISGQPKLNFFRKFLWKLAAKKLYCITCPTTNTFNYLKKIEIIDKKKLKILYDPILDIQKIQNLKKEKIFYKDYFLAVGRLTKQKNFIFLCEAFKKIVKINKNFKLIIAGEGEDKKKIDNFIIKNNLEKNIFLIGHKKNIFPYFRNSKGFILSSLWEDPGFVLIEAFFCRTPVLTSNSYPGPIEIVKDLKNGFVFENNNLDNFLKKFNEMNNYKNLNSLILNGLKVSKKFTLFNHYKNLDKLLLPS